MIVALDSPRSTSRYSKKAVMCFLSGVVMLLFYDTLVLEANKKGSSELLPWLVRRRQDLFAGGVDNYL